ncbi:hypothetical protein [Methanolobus psychrotolerans]|uniref:hypothetical protein n=1 Tax=Methanolobus psychrotolerans TaxID=1874706 RepID=UPI00101AEA9D|nr:hypothetical protein [Methanolobus psychrotolerans]
MSLFNKLFSTTSPTPTSKKSTPIGAHVGDDPYQTYITTLAWIKETKAKMPDGSVFEVTPSMREEAFKSDPLLKGTITPFLMNSLLGSYVLNTADNKKFQPAIKEIRQYLVEIGLLAAFRDDFKDYTIIHGHSFRRKDPNNDSIERLAPLKNSTIATYRDPWDSTVAAYHQKIYVNNSWTENSSTTEYNTWFIPGGKMYVEGEVSDPRALDIFGSIKEKYGITDTTNLRVDSTDRIIAMHRVEPGEPAPIDSAILAIWLKRLLLTNSPNIIFRVLSPFVHIKNGLVLEVTGADGGKDLITTVPQQPPAGMEETDPEQYAAQSSMYNTWISACKTAAANVLKSLKDGGVFSSGPDTEMQVIESGRSVPSAFIKTMLDLLDQEIGQAFGFPVALVKANGSELATSRTILELFNTTYAGVRHDYEVVADELIRDKFAGKSWTYSVPGKDDTTETGTFTFADMECRFQLDTVDVKDRLSEAQAKLTDAQTLQAIKSVGAGRSDIQALGEEAGFGVLDLDNFDNTLVDTGQLSAQEDLNTQAITSTSREDLTPSESDESDLKEDLLKAYKDIQNDFQELV